MKQDSDYVKAFHLFLPFKYFKPAMKIVLKVFLFYKFVLELLCAGT